MSFSLASRRLPMAVLLGLLVLLCANTVQSAEATNICICECCSGSACLADWNATFAIGSCSDCTKDLCISQFSDCKTSTDIDAKCINRDSIWNKATIIIFLITLATLIVIGCLRNQSPYLQKMIATGNAAH